LTYVVTAPGAHNDVLADTEDLLARSRTENRAVGCHRHGEQITLTLNTSQHPVVSILWEEID
jgi:hypothetical protein